MTGTILEVKDLQTYFTTRRGTVKAVDGVSFTLNQGETLGLVGESGCGKSMTCLSILRLVPKPTGHIVGGQIIFDGEDILLKSEDEMRQIRGRRISMILQDPMTSLNPVITLGEQVAEVIRRHFTLSKHVIWERVKNILERVRIPSPSVVMHQYPHQISGGMRQRVVTATSVSCQPHLLMADEPTTALDVTIQAQVLNLLKDIQQESGASMIMVTHDFGIVANVCDRVAVMYAGKIVESADIMELFDHPIHPYTVGLLGSLPRLDEKLEKLYSIGGQPPDLGSLPQGCSFSPRCAHTREICNREYPPQKKVDNRHLVSCWLVHEGSML